MPSWTTQLVIVLINTVSQPASQQVPRRTHHTGPMIQAVCQNYVKQLTTLSRRHIWRHMARRHSKNRRRVFSLHLKQQLVAPHRRSSLSVEYYSETNILQHEKCGVSIYQHCQHSACDIDNCDLKRRSWCNSEVQCSVTSTPVHDVPFHCHPCSFVLSPHGINFILISVAPGYHKHLP